MNRLHRTAAGGMLLSLVALVCAGSVPIAQAKSIDELVEAEAARQAAVPLDVVDDAAFLRRVTVDLIGRIPTESEYRLFVALPAEQRREQTIERLLKHEEFADRWAVFFGDMFRVRADADGGRELGGFIRQALGRGMPYDQMVREMLTASGAPGAQPAAGFLVSEDVEPFEMAGVVSQTLMGVRMKCAQCHDHPFDVWTRREYYELAAYFSHTSLYRRNQPFRVTKVTMTREAQVKWPPEGSSSTRPRRGMTPQWPFAAQIADASSIQSALKRRESAMAMRSAGQLGDELFDLTRTEVRRVSRMEGELDSTRSAIRADGTGFDPVGARRELAKLVTSADNAYFAWNIVNRIWAELLGRGIVDPVDDFRGVNPPSHPQLLDHLALEFIAGNYDIRKLIGMIVRSQTYQRRHLDNVPTAERERLERLFAAAPLRRMNAETLYDSIITAGHLDKGKHRREDFIRRQQVTIAVPRNLRELQPQMAKQLNAEIALTPPDMRSFNAEGDDFDRLHADLNDPLSDLRLLAISTTETIPAEIIEEAKKRVEAMFQGKIEYDFRQETREVDTRPQFTYARRMLAPAPSEHFLRQFGQPARVLLGEQRESSPSMRQALIMLNGQLTNEAARVGRLERVGQLLEQNRLPDAVEQAYLEILTRVPTDAEMANAMSLVGGAEDPYAAMADLRWALLNCHEFRYLP